MPEPALRSQRARPKDPIILCPLTVTDRRSLLPCAPARGFGAMLRDVFPTVSPAPLIGRLLSVGSCDRYSFSSRHISWRHYNRNSGALSTRNRKTFEKKKMQPLPDDRSRRILLPHFWLSTGGKLGILIPWRFVGPGAFGTRSIMGRIPERSTLEQEGSGLGVSAFN